MSNAELIIDETNFEEHFFDVRRNKPQKGQVMARFCAVAVFGDGREKRDIINLLKMDKSHQAAQVMKKIHLAREPDCYKICREICEDLISGMSEDEVAAKEHEFVLEAFYYTLRENVPIDDPRWELIQLFQFNPETNTFIL